jgi:arabinogalactan oligomer/maltooligosaccharide transport system permease protein
MSLARTLGWVVMLAVLVWLVFGYIIGFNLPFVPDGRGLIERLPSTTPGGFIRVERGWVWVLAGLLFIAALIGLYSLVVVRLSNRRTGRNKNFVPLFLQGLTHLILVLVLVFIYYPILQILAASFDPTNSLYKFFPPASDNLLIRARVLPDFSRASLENYARLFDGIVVFPYQWFVIAAALIGLLALLALGAYRRFTGDQKEDGLLAKLQSRSLLIFGIAFFLLIVFIQPAQFTGLNTEAKFILWIRNTLFVSGLTGLLAIVLTATAGYAFARFNFPGRYSLLLVFIFIQMFPGFLGLIAIYTLMSNLGLLNTYSGLVLAYSGGIISFGTWVYKGFLENIPRSLEEAALIDGASKWQVFYKILLPLSTPMFVFIFLLQAVGTYSEFILANIFLTGVNSWTIGVGLRNFTTGQFQTKWGLFAAASVLGSLPILFTFYGFQRYFVSGYTAGSVKE